MIKVLHYFLINRMNKWMIVYYCSYDITNSIKAILINNKKKVVIL